MDSLLGGRPLSLAKCPAAFPEPAVSREGGRVDAANPLTAAGDATEEDGGVSLGVMAGVSLVTDARGRACIPLGALILGGRERDED